MAHTAHTDIEQLLAEITELRLAVAELSCKTDLVISEVSGLNLRVDRLKMDKLVIDKLEIEGLELSLKFENTGGNSNDCK